MANIDLKPYLNKFITVTIDDGKEESGFIANPEEFKEETRDDSILDLPLWLSTRYCTAGDDDIARSSPLCKPDTLSKLLRRSLTRFCASLGILPHPSL